MNKRFIIILILAGLTLTPAAQVADTLNRTDKNGMKQGHWIKRDQYDHVIYDGYFRDNKPSGSFKRYYDDGKLQSVLVFSSDSKTADAIFYHQNGLKASGGKYINQSREGKWQFFSAYMEGYLICEEEYLNNRKNGLSVKYYLDKTPSEKLTYVNDTKSGEWTQYYPSGKVCIRANYVEGKLQGGYTVFYENGKPEFSGQYKDDARDGTWLKYNTDETVKARINYVKGMATNPELYIKETQYLDSMERNKGKIQDPEKTGILWK